MLMMLMIIVTIAISLLVSLATTGVPVMCYCCYRYFGESASAHEHNDFAVVIGDFKTLVRLVAVGCPGV